MARTPMPSADEPADSSANPAPDPAHQQFVSGSEGKPGPTMLPEALRAPVPTVIGERVSAQPVWPQDAALAPVPRSPTVLGQPVTRAALGAASRGSPSVASVCHAAPAPTVMAGTPATSPAVKATYVHTASVVPGVVRKAIAVSLSELAAYFVGVDPEVLAQVQQILGRTVWDTLSALDCAQWGVTVQANYQDNVNAALAHSAAPALRDGMQHLQRLNQVLSELAQALHKPASKGLAFWVAPRTPGQVFQDLKPELDALAARLQNTLPQLRSLQVALAQDQQACTQLMRDTHAHSLAAQWLAEQFSQDARATALGDRALRLTHGLAHMQESLVLRQAHARDIEALACTIQDAVLVVLPGWLERFVLLYAHAEVNPTERYTLLQSLEALLGQLT